MTRSTAALLLLASACTARNPAFCPEGEDSTGECIRADAARACFGPPSFEICVAPPVESRTLGRINTTDECDEIVTLGRELCVVKGTDVLIGQRVLVRGSRPAVILATNVLTIDENGIVDATGSDTVGGPGADAACGAGAGTDNFDGAGGGAGGSFGTRGGNGGHGDGNVGRGGTAAAVPPAPTMLQGGCSGADGGDGSTAGTGGVRGHGGGGVYLIGGRTLRLQGSINASGSGGQGGRPSKAGGGGGGSGGMIVLYTPNAEVMASAQIFANGGGGGSGAKGATKGLSGGMSTTPFSVPSGGAAVGGSGGSGAFATTPAAPGMSSPDGGGGGGGGAGVIYILSGNFTGASISPPPI